MDLQLILTTSYACLYMTETLTLSTFDPIHLVLLRRLSTASWGRQQVTQFWLGRGGTASLEVQVFLVVQVAPLFLVFPSRLVAQLDLVVLPGPGSLGAPWVLGFHLYHCGPCHLSAPSHHVGLVDQEALWLL